MDGETIGLVIGGVVAIAILFSVHLTLRRATRKQIEDEDLWDEIYHREEDLEYHDLFRDFDAGETPDSKKISKQVSKSLQDSYRLSELTQRLRDKHRYRED